MTKLRLQLVIFIIFICSLPAVAANNPYDKKSIGVIISNTVSGKGVLITEIDSNYPAYQAGLEADDLVLTIDGVAVNDTDVFIRKIKNSQGKLKFVAERIDQYATGKVEKRIIVIYVKPKISDYRYMGLTTVLPEKKALAKKLFKEGKQKLAYELFKQGAILGDVDSMNWVADIYLTGEGADKDIDNAYYWYVTASDSGSIYAQYKLGTIYQYGYDSISSDLEEALSWYKKAADQGHERSKEKVADLNNPFFKATQGTVNFFKEHKEEVIIVTTAVAAAVLANEVGNYCFDPHDNSCTNEQEKHHNNIYNHVNRSIDKADSCGNYNDFSHALRAVGLTFVGALMGSDVELFGLNDMSRDVAASGIEIYQAVCD